MHPISCLICSYLRGYYYDRGHPSFFSAYPTTRPVLSLMQISIYIYIHHPNPVGLRLLTTLANVDGSIHGNFQLLQINGPQLAYWKSLIGVFFLATFNEMKKEKLAYWGEVFIKQSRKKVTVFIDNIILQCWQHTDYTWTPTTLSMSNLFLWA